MIEIHRDVFFAQARGIALCLHIGSTAIYIGRSEWRNLRIELFTPARLFRWSWCGP